MRIALLSDIHSNLAALDAVLSAVGSVDAIWHLGDVVGYGPDPDAVVERLAVLGAIGVCGNHDVAAVSSEGVEYFNVDARRAIQWTSETISPATREWLRALPETRTVGDFELVHGSPRGPVWEYVTSAPVARASLAALTATYGLHGHTHVPAVFRDDDGAIELISPRDGSSLRFDGRPLLLNPGSVGQPRDGDPDASYAIVDTDRGEVTWHRAPYDIAATQAAMSAAGLPERLVARLDHGL
jgi:diadenosine tetraphosphatase ApaH/serine/threonine PP2A family protein phosphatase